MAKSKKESNNLQLVDVGALALSLWFVLSVINNVQDMIEQNIKNAPASYALIASLGLVTYTCYKRNKFSPLNVVVLSVLATAMSIWLFGLSTQLGY